MDGVQEVVKVAYSGAQNAKLAQGLGAYYKLSLTPIINKELYVEKDSYKRFLSAKMRERTPFQAARAFSDFTFNEAESPFSVTHSKISFTFPSGRAVTLTEYLSEPNGTTKTVELADSGGKPLTFDSYFHAESEVVSRFIAEIE